ncbi:MAG: GspE/PulE family protein [Campylobacterales bacterium]|nr:GspE/PulE family protein [Campylobacterales bacterium]
MLKQIVEYGIITQEQAQLIDKLHYTTKKDIDLLLEEYGYINSVTRAQMQARQNEIPYVDLSSHSITEEALQCITKEKALEYTLLPLYVNEHELTIAINEAADFGKLIFLERHTQKNIRFVYTDTQQLLSHIQMHYYGEKSLQVYMYDFETSDVILLLNTLLNSAIDYRASDIHLSPEHDALHVFFRIDGVLQHMAVVKLEMLSSLAVRIKTLSNLDISQKRIAMDGSFSHHHLDKEFDFRVSTLPTDMGENIVMRILSKDANLFKVDNLGINESNTKKIKELIHKPYGVILITGPTGSGKTTTLYAVLNEINRLQKNILTIENPIEYRFPFIKQTQYNPKAGFTYDMAIKSFMRQDPDVIMVGEIRDPQTAELAMEASITGHMVLSTLHTNDALSAITRLKSLDVAPYLLGSGMLAVLAQRLVRKLCEHCKIPQELQKEDLKNYNFGIDDLNVAKDITIFKACGCDRCYGLGYKGRIAIVEIVEIDKQMQRYISDGATESQLHTYTKEQGMKTLRDDALEKVFTGKTSFDEVERHIF